MRITQSMLANNSLRNLSKSYSNMGKYQDQLATGKKINKPSDDPVVAMKGMYYRSNLVENEQYQRNLSELYLWMENSESGIEQIGNGLHRVRELVIQGKNGSLADEDKKAIANEIKQIKDDIAATANTKVAGRYIFNGTNTTEPPVVEGDPPVLSPNFNKDEYVVSVSNGVKLKANTNAENIFSDELFSTLNNIEKALNGDLPITELETELANLDTHFDNLLAERSELGARYNRLEMIDDRLSQQEVTANRVLSDNEDADIERVITDLKTQESIHRAALGVGARIIQPTLMDFLR